MSATKRPEERRFFCSWRSRNNGARGSLERRICAARYEPAYARLAAFASNPALWPAFRRDRRRAERPLLCFPKRRPETGESSFIVERVERRTREDGAGPCLSRVRWAPRWRRRLGLWARWVRRPCDMQATPLRTPCSSQSGDGHRAREPKTSPHPRSPTDSGETWPSPIFTRTPFERASTMMRTHRFPDALFGKQRSGLSARASVSAERWPQRRVDANAARPRYAGFIACGTDPPARAPRVHCSLIATSIKENGVSSGRLVALMIIR